MEYSVLCCVGRRRFQFNLVGACDTTHPYVSQLDFFCIFISPCLVHPKHISPVTSLVPPRCLSSAASHPPLHCSVPRPPLPSACSAALPRSVGDGSPHTNTHLTPAAGTRGSGSCNVATGAGGCRASTAAETGRRREGEMLRVATRSSFDVDRFSGWDLELVRFRGRTISTTSLM